MTFENLIVETKDRIARVTVNRPKVLNALNEKTVREIHAAFASLRWNADVGAVILTGAGEKAFVAGADINELAVMTPLQGEASSKLGQAALREIETLGKPVIAAINGFALGGGCELALACHVRFASENAKLGLPEVGLGIIPGAGGTQRLTRLIGPAKAKDLIYSGRFVPAAEALALGLVDRVVPDAEVYKAARAWAATFVNGPALALRAAKQAIDAGLEVDLATGLEIERLQFAALFATEDQKTGMRSFVEEGPGKAKFQGQ